MKKYQLMLPIILLLISGCKSSNEPSSSSSSFEGSNSSSEPSSESENEQRMREDRVLSLERILPLNQTTSDTFRQLNQQPNQVGNDYFFNSGRFCLKFTDTEDGYQLSLIDNLASKQMFQIVKPVKLYFRATGGGQIESNYQTVALKPYGILATANLTSKNGSKFLIEDYYHMVDESMVGVINIQRSIKVIEAKLTDTGYQSIYSIFSNNETAAANLEWFVPNSIFGSFPNVMETMPYKLFRETLLGLPMALMRDKTNGYAFSLARYQPVVEYLSNSFASIGVHQGTTSSGTNHSSVEITYPTRDTARRYFSLTEQPQTVYDLTLQLFKTNNFDEAMVTSYTNQFLLQDQRIINSDIDEVYRIINEDFKTFMLSKTAKGFTSYGLPWRVTLDTGKIGPRSYQAGFVGQQIPAAYHMMVYGIQNNDNVSLQNGINIINFWIHDAKMMTPAGVPMIWFNGENNTWAGYPTFTRMAVDAMEGLFDAYRLAQKYQIETSGWFEAIKATADFFVNAQNADGSWYRCYNYQGTYYRGNEADIPWNPGNIAQSTSKNNATMPIRFLGKMYEFTNDERYLQALLAGGDFVYQHLYPQHAYFGGTCDNPDAMDKEAGVFAMYAFDTLYTLTKDSKWLTALKQATIFTMSTVLTLSFKIASNATSLKAANGMKYGYTDGLSYIVCNGTGLDNYAAFIYYQLFRLYIYSGEIVYLNMAEFIQQNTKGAMDWDNTLDFAYRSLVPEATTIYSFGFASAQDDEGVQGVWLPWSSVANAEPIAKMYENFNTGDVKVAAEISQEDLLAMLTEIGVGGYPHHLIT